MANFPTAITLLAGVLNKRHLTPDDANQIGLEICTQAEAEADLKMRIGGNVSFCEKLPYYGLLKQFTGYVRYRINYKDDGTYTDREGNVYVWPKYLTAKGFKQQFAYLPKLRNMDWGNTIVNPAEPLLLTEGEYKSITACKAGIPCVGLPGVWNFNHKGNNLPIPLDEANWIGKTVLVCFDADEQSSYENPLKRQVLGAAFALCTKLYRLGAKPEILYIARTKAFTAARILDSKVKMGLDDFLFAGGDFGELLATRHNPIHCEHLAILNSQYAVCRGQAGTGVMDIGLGKLYRTHDFLKTVENNRIRPSTGPKGGVSKVYVAEEFLEQSNRPEVHRVVFEPSWGTGYDRENSIYNQWSGWPDLGMGLETEGRQEVIVVWQRLLEKLFGPHWPYFEKWAAHMIQRPGEKTSIGVILVSVLNGVGKSLLGEVLRGVVGPEYGRACPLERLKSNFNSPLERCLFLQMDEANGLQDGLETKLNDLITADTVTIERKGFDPIVVNNYMRLFMTSNSPRPIRLNKENRRWLVVSANVVESELAEWGIWLGTAAKLLKSQGGLQAIREHLELVDLTEWDPTARVEVTEYMDDMVESSRSWNALERDSLLEKCREDYENNKLWLITSELAAAGGGKVWSDFKEHVRAHGGRTLRHQLNVAGKRTRGVVVDLDSCLPRKPESAGTGNGSKWALNTAEGLGRFEESGTWADAIMRATRAWNEVTSIVKGSEKF